MTNWREHKELQQALQKYLAENDLTLDGSETYESGIDCVCVLINKKPIFYVGLPPVSNYPVEETEHTYKYLQIKQPIAV